MLLSINKLYVFFVIINLDLNSTHSNKNSVLRSSTASYDANSSSLMMLGCSHQFFQKLTQRVTKFPCRMSKNLYKVSPTLLQNFSIRIDIFKISKSGSICLTPLFQLRYQCVKGNLQLYYSKKVENFQLFLLVRKGMRET